MKKIITLALSALMSLSLVGFAGCTTRAPSGDFTINGDSSGSGLPQGTPFKATLQTVDGGKLNKVEELSAIWTSVEGSGIHRAPFNANGVATAYGLDGEYQITLSGLPEGYTYDPNVHFADNRENSDKVIELYPLRELTGGSGKDAMNDFCILSESGAYRFVFENENDYYYFSFGARYSGQMNIKSLIDISSDEINPKFYAVTGTPGIYVGSEVPAEGGGVSGKHTKNFSYDFGLTNSQSMLFKIAVDAINDEVSFPVSVDLLIQKKGEYSLDEGNLTMVPAPTDLEVNGGETEPTGSFRLLADEYGGQFKQENWIYDEADDRYYATNANGEADKSKMIYAVLTKNVSGIIDSDGDTGLSYGMVRHSCYSSGKDYTEFIQAYFAKVNRQGSFPVTAALQEYLYDYSESHQIFFDGYGVAEPTYRSDSKSRWLFVCGYYK